MHAKLQCIGLYTILRREIVRMFRITSQVFLPPVITTALYFLIFGTIIGRRIGSIEGTNYNVFIAPGLIMMSVITNAYSNVSSSLFSLRFQKSIEEILVSPLHPYILLLGYVLGGIMRGMLVATLVFFVAWFFLPVQLNHLPYTLCIILLVATLFSLAGFLNGMLAHTFDDIMLVPTFVLTPLTYLGGIFYSITMLPPLWQTLSHFNPIMYMVNALRYAMIGFEGVSMTLSLVVIMGMIFFLIAVDCWLLKKGTGLRD